MNLLARNLRVSAYKEMTLRFFHSINLIKQIKKFPQIDDSKKIEFSFKKQENKKLIFFDLDETLIHAKKTTEDLEEDELY